MRILAFIFFLLAFGALALDLVGFANSGELALKPLGQRWFEIHSPSLQQFEPAVARHISPGLWSGFIQPILQAPAFLVFLALGLLFALLSRLISKR